MYTSNKTIETFKHLYLKIVKRKKLGLVRPRITTSQFSHFSGNETISLTTMRYQFTIYRIYISIIYHIDLPFLLRTPPYNPSSSSFQCIRLK